jgi:GH24 family phage-related lysozyme (muramidase)
MSKTRIAAYALTLSAVAFVGRMAHENYVDEAVIPVKGDRPTVGFGMTWRPDGSPVQMGDRTNPVEALQRSLAHVQRDEAALKKCLTAELFPAEFDMLMDHAYQYGVPVTCKSGMVREANAGRHREACEAYLSYRFITNGRPGAGWEPYRWNSAGAPTRWRFDCSTPGNKVCGGVWKDAQRRHRVCTDAQ